MQNYKEVYEGKMKKTMEMLIHEFSTIRAGRANPHVLDKIMVDYYGSPTPIQQVGNISVPEARIIQISPWDKTTLKAIEKAIMQSDLGINPSNDGSTLRLVFPELTEDRRKALGKDVKKKGDDFKIAIRNVRREAIDEFKKIEKAKEITEDELKTREDALQKMTDKYVAEIDKAVEEKTKDIMSI